MGGHTCFDDTSRCGYWQRQQQAGNTEHLSRPTARISVSGHRQIFGIPRFFRLKMLNLRHEGASLREGQSEIKHANACEALRDKQKAHWQTQTQT